MQIFLPFVLSLIILAGNLGYAEVIFYKNNTRIAKVDCKTNQLTIKNNFHTTLNIRQSYNKEEFGDLCQALYRFSESNPAAIMTGHSRAVTLLTVEEKVIDNSIYKEEVVGVFDLDSGIIVVPSEKRDPIDTQYCSQLNSNTRMSTEICLFVSKSGLYFLEFKSPQTYKLLNTAIALQLDNQIILESKTSEGEVEVKFLGTFSSDRKSIQATINFNTGASASISLNKQ